MRSAFSSRTMVIQQTCVLERHFLVSQGNRISYPSLPPRSSFSRFVHSLPSFRTKRSSLEQKAKCWHENDGPVQQFVCAKPMEVPWKKELCNHIRLIGIVGCPVEMRHLSSGKDLAWTRLAFKKSVSETVWIGLTFWDELARVAFQHVTKGHQIYVSGRLVSDTVQSDDGNQVTYYKVVVQQLNFVQRNQASTVPSTTTTVTTQRTFTANTSGSVEELWQAFFANPFEWWDNRKTKRNPKYPDFKHKDTGESLWIDGNRNPSWVKSQLDILDSRMALQRENEQAASLSFSSVLES